jgi:hypothetical protein
LLNEYIDQLVFKLLEVTLVLVRKSLKFLWKKDNHSNEVIFQFERKSKKFHERESFHQERSLNTVPIQIVHWLPNNRNLISQQNFFDFLSNWKITSLEWLSFFHIPDNRHCIMVYISYYNLFLIWEITPIVFNLYSW